MNLVEISGKCVAKNLRKFEAEDLQCLPHRIKDIIRNFAIKCESKFTQETYIALLHSRMTKVTKIKRIFSCFDNKLKEIFRQLTGWMVQFEDTLTFSDTVPVQPDDNCWLREYLELAFGYFCQSEGVPIQLLGNKEVYSKRTSVLTWKQIFLKLCESIWRKERDKIDFGKMFSGLSQLVSISLIGMPLKVRGK